MNMHPEDTAGMQLAIAVVTALEAEDPEALAVLFAAHPPAELIPPLVLLINALAALAAQQYGRTPAEILQMFAVAVEPKS